MVFKSSSLIGYLLKIVSVIAVLGIIFLALGIEFYGLQEAYKTLVLIIGGYNAEDDVVKKTLHSLDIILLGIVFLAIGAGLFELFVQKINNLPSWLIIEDLDDHKGLIIKMIIVVISISFAGSIITWDGKENLLGLGVGLAAVVLALSYFLVVKAKKAT